MFQNLVERAIGLAMVAEPYSILDVSRGAGDQVDLVAIFSAVIAVSPPPLLGD